jgi:hypothetical protein
MSVMSHDVMMSHQILLLAADCTYIILNILHEGEAVPAK